MTKLAAPPHFWHSTTSLTFGHDGWFSKMSFTSVHGSDTPNSNNAYATLATTSGNTSWTHPTSGCRSPDAASSCSAAEISFHQTPCAREIPREPSSPFSTPVARGAHRLSSIPAEPVRRSSAPRGRSPHSARPPAFFWSIMAPMAAAAGNTSAGLFVQLPPWTASHSLPTMATNPKCECSRSPNFAALWASTTVSGFLWARVATRSGSWGTASALRSWQLSSTISPPPHYSSGTRLCPAVHHMNECDGSSHQVGAPATDTSAAPLAIPAVVQKSQISH